MWSSGKYIYECICIAATKITATDSWLSGKNWISLFQHGFWVFLKEKYLDVWKISWKPFWLCIHGQKQILCLQFYDSQETSEFLCQSMTLGVFKHFWNEKHAVWKIYLYRFWIHLYLVPWAQNLNFWKLNMFYVVLSHSQKFKFFSNFNCFIVTVSAEFTSILASSLKKTAKFRYNLSLVLIMFLCYKFLYC